MVGHLIQTLFQTEKHKNVPPPRPELGLLFLSGSIAFHSLLVSGDHTL